MKSIGIYTIKKLIAKGGMGEVFLAHDPICERVVALKKIRKEYLDYASIKQRFLKEARIASQLSHPSIIPIYFIHQEEYDIYYTMPFIEGETLKDILKATIDRFQAGEAPHPIGSSIPTLIRIFLNICQATSFAHSKNILHRDLKPGNIMVGKFGQVLILDWGLAQYTEETNVSEEAISIPESIPKDLTRPGKAVGTLSYMAPERAFHYPANVKTDIYSLGVILYQMLTLKAPFQRKSLKAFRKEAKYERLKNPIEIAPERDIPMQLSQIVKKCLAFHPEDRYESVPQLIAALENYIEGKPDWIFQTELSIHNPNDWEFQENILLNRNIALSRSSDLMRWVMLMISKSTFIGNFRIESSLSINYGSDGLGFLFCIPEADAKQELKEGFCLWLGTKKNPGIRLYRSNVEVLSIGDLFLKKRKRHHITIEKIENRVSLYIDDQLIFNFVAYIPLIGSHIGLVSRDMDFDLHNWKIYVGSQSAMINCLSIPDTFLAQKNYTNAYHEYQRIAQSFRGRIEGREAIFRAGITLLEQAKSTKGQQQKDLLENANAEFEKLSKTSGAPLEYLGKSLIYHLEQDAVEEAKCLELALRKFPKHPLISKVQEQVIFRIHESARTNRLDTYRFTFIALHLLREDVHSKENLMLFSSVEKNIEPLSIFQKPPRYSSKKEHFSFLSIILAYWLSEPHKIIEIVKRDYEHVHHKELFVSNALFGLLFLKNPMLEPLIDWFASKQEDKNARIDYLIHLLKICANIQSKPLLNTLEKLKNAFIQPISLDEVNLLYYCLIFSLKSIQERECRAFLELFSHIKIDKKAQKFADSFLIYLLLLNKEFDRAFKIFNQYPTEVTHPLSRFYSPYAILMIATKPKRKALEPYMQLMQLPHPPLTALMVHFLVQNISLKGLWMQEALHPEKRAF